MKTIKLLPLLTAGLLVVLMTSCGPAYVSTGVGYGPRPYYGYGYNPYGYGYGYARPYGYYRPPVVVRPAPRYYSPAPRYYGGGSPNARRGYGGGGGFGGGGRSRGPR
ncbi:hypothetical protein [Spirosoma foliorum]|uniref:Neuropeptide-like protein 29 n=1 Tax=Spirosoma foliorum TaxID=2710596 RepID=A0A7G5GTE2_9BACT|nr:hypothetical protein [Spirosoma foliorum]QMW02134.1 hypothetical protein H3H32_30055 [Spirosoma foliorum]